MPLLIAQILFWLCFALLVLATLLPLSKIPFGAVRGLEFPRLQWAGLSAIMVPCGWALFDGDLRLWLITALVLIAAVQVLYIVKFTPFWRKQSADAVAALQANDAAQISLLTANVKLSNRDYPRLIDLIRREKPDVVMAIEVDADWIAALEELKSDYAHWVPVPRDTGYGICLMSRLDVSDTEVRDWVTEGVPSIKTTLELRNGATCRLYVVHPEPPIASHDTKGRDSEIVVAGIAARDDPLPAIVTGDLNDVAWSTTTRRFQRLSGLQDPRVGRGFYNTFNAFYPVFRWPLDHLFHDPRFRHVSVDRMEKIGSDHFPVLFRLALTAEPSDSGSSLETDAQEEAEARDMVAEEAARDRAPIGTDWEDDGNKG